MITFLIAGAGAGAAAAGGCLGARRLAVLEHYHRHRTRHRAGATLQRLQQLPAPVWLPPTLPEGPTLAEYTLEMQHRDWLLRIRPPEVPPLARARATAAALELAVIRPAAAAWTAAAAAADAADFERWPWLAPPWEDSTGSFAAVSA